MRLLKAADHRRMAWKNGGGETVEIAVHPPGAGLGDFDWRVSVARVGADGPFSVFEGIDRTLAVLSGEGMDVMIEGHGHPRLTPASDPLSFPADAPTTARLVGGPITDLNVMTRRGALSHRVTRLGEAPFAARGRWIVLLAATPAELSVDGQAVRLDGFDVLCLEGEATILRQAGAVFVAEIDVAA